MIFPGVIGELVPGRWHDPHTGVKQTIPVESIAIADTLDGSEAELVHRVHPGKSLCVVSDQWTRAALGERVFRALQPLGNVKEFVWERPRITPDGLDELMAGAGHAQVVIAIGSGTVTNNVKIGHVPCQTRILGLSNLADERLYDAHGFRVPWRV